MAISTAQQYFDQIISGGIPALQRMVDERQPETEWLDFKAQQGMNDDAVKSLWSKAICGFANNQGGVLIWGVDARKDKTTEIDAACAVSFKDHCILPAISNYALFDGQ